MPYSDDEILSSLRECYEENGKVTIRSFREFKGPSSGTVINRFGSFNEALEAANIEKNGIWRNYSRETLLDHVKQVAEQNSSIRPKHFGGNFADRGQIDREFGSIGKAAGIAECHDSLPDYFSCDDCGGLFMHLGSHISDSSCSFGNLSKYEKSLYAGILMGDGSIGEREGIPNFTVSMSGSSGKKFTKWLQSEITIPSKRSERVLDNPNHNTIYTVRTQSHEHFNSLASWYDGGQKLYPRDLSLTPTKLKMWYVSDGSLSDGGPIFTCWNESHRSEFLLSLFNNIGLSVTWQPHNNDVYIKKESEPDFFDYIGSPPPGFEYKWL